MSQCDQPDQSYDNCRFSVRLAGRLAQDCSANEDWVIKPIGVVNNLCSLVATLDEDTQTKMLGLVDLNCASPRSQKKKRSAIRKFFSVQEEQVDSIYISADCPTDQDVNEAIKTQFGTKLKVVDFSHTSISFHEVP